MLRRLASAVPRALAVEPVVQVGNLVTSPVTEKARGRELRRAFAVRWRSTHLLVGVVAPEQREQQTTPPLNPPLCPHRQQQQQKKRNVSARYPGYQVLVDTQVPRPDTQVSGWRGGRGSRAGCCRRCGSRGTRTAGFFCFDGGNGGSICAHRQGGGRSNGQGQRHQWLTRSGRWRPWRGARGRRGTAPAPAATGSVRAEAATQWAEDGVEEAWRDHPRRPPDFTDAVPSSSSSAAGDDDDDPFLLVGFFSAFSALSREREREFVEGKGRR
uniref:Uncharacterized protein n=1 Tax=Oryza nivara TaxID=4536 RepID=A0A0E0I1N1_ORYNI